MSNTNVCRTSVCNTNGCRTDFSRRIVLVASLVILAIFSALTVELFLCDHHCTGDDCAVCLCIETVKNNLRNCGAGDFCPCLSSIYISSVFICVSCSLFCVSLTLVAQKIKLND